MIPILSFIIYIYVYTYIFSLVKDLLQCHELHLVVVSHLSCYSRRVSQDFLYVCDIIL